MFDNLGFNPVVWRLVCTLNFQYPHPAAVRVRGSDSRLSGSGHRHLLSTSTLVYSIYHGEEDTCVFTKPRHVRLKDQHVYLSDFLVQINVAH